MSRYRQSAHIVALLAAAWLTTFPGTSSAQVSLSPVQLVRMAVQNETDSNDDGAKFMFREMSQGADGSKTKLIVETRDAMAGLLIAVNGRPLSAAQREAEEKRLEHLANDPDDLDKKRKREKEDAERTKKIIKAFPEAFLYEKDGVMPGEERMGAPGDQLVRLKFRPNPKYTPPSHLEQILTGLQGTILIDSTQHRIAKIDAGLMKEVAFGWGILGHLDRGGRFMVQQGDMGGGHWEMTCLDLAFTGKAVFFKTLNIKAHEVYSDFKAAPENLTFAQGVEMLKKQEALIAQNEVPGGQNRK